MTSVHVAARVVHIIAGGLGIASVLSRSSRRRAHGCSKTPWYQAFDNVLGPLYPLLRRLLPAHVTTTENIGRAMIRVAARGYAKRVLENPDINLPAETAA